MKSSKKPRISNKTLCILLGIQVVFLAVLYIFVNVFINQVVIPGNQELAVLLMRVQWFLFSTLGGLCSIFIPICITVILYRILKSLEYIQNNINVMAKTEPENEVESDEETSVTP